MLIAFHPARSLRSRVVRVAAIQAQVLLETPVASIKCLLLRAVAGHPTIKVGFGERNSLALENDVQDPLQTCNLVCVCVLFGDFFYSSTCVPLTPWERAIFAQNTSFILRVLILRWSVGAERPVRC